jgi:hypothetical protein
MDGDDAHTRCSAGQGKPGVTRSAQHAGFYLKGDHGYDNALLSMGALFVTAGPSVLPADR